MQGLELREEHLPRVVIGGVLVTSVLSLVLGLASDPDTGQTAVNWVSDWLLDFSTDLAMGGAALTAFRTFWRVSQRPAERTTYDYIEAEPESAPATVTPPTSVLPQHVDQLRQAVTPQARQTVMDDITTQNISMVDSNLVELNFEGVVMVYADMRRSNLSRAVLKGADLSNANLSACNLFMAQLIKANLREANMDGASLERAFTSGADMHGASLRGAVIHTALWGVNLQNADLAGADLRGAEIFRTDLRGANLVGANLAGAKINKDTLLPDGSYMNKRTVLARFTDPNHPDFWRSDDPASPAFGS